MNTEEFLKNASSKSKTIGNNRYQEEIKNLNDKIEEMSKSINNKDEELNLFKRNFTDMQIQFQEKNINIMELNNKLTKSQLDNKELNNKILNLNDMNLMLISNLEKDKQKIQNEKDEYVNNMNIFLNDKNDLQVRYDDIKIKYKEILSELHSKINSFEELNTQYTANLREFNLLKEQNNTISIELNTLKQEFSLANNEINSLRIILIEKEVLVKEKEHQLKDFHSRLFTSKNLFNTHLKLNTCKSCSLVIEDTKEDMENKEVNSQDLKEEIDLKTIKEITTPLVSKRGLKVSRR
jgi:chromosome segregation ATPase